MQQKRICSYMLPHQYIPGSITNQVSRTIAMHEESMTMVCACFWLVLRMFCETHTLNEAC